MGMVCAVGAVACLASMIVHWSQQYPVHRSLWEQDLFGDLTDANPVPAQKPLSPVPQDVTRAKSSSPGRPASPAGTHAPALDEPAVVAVKPELVGHVLATPIEKRPVEHQPRFIQPVLHEQPTPGPSVWLSGDIEVGISDVSGGRTAPATLFFPNESLAR